MTPEMMAIQCNLPSARPTTLPARCVLGKTWKAVGASTKAKKINPPIQTTSDKTMTKRRKDMTENYSLRGQRKSFTTGATEEHRGLRAVACRQSLLYTGTATFSMMSFRTWSDCSD